MDSMLVFFKKDGWLVGMSKAILNIHQGLGMDHTLNFTYIALIPKKFNSQCVTEFRLINLYNVIYKLIFKVIVNRLKFFMDAIILPPQSAFPYYEA